MKKLSLILVAMATLVMVGCKPLTGSTVCTHDWVDTDDEKVASAYYDGKSNLTTKQVSPKYKCSKCGEINEKTIAFFDSPTTIGVAKGVSWTRFLQLPIDTTWTVEKYNSYYENRNNYSNDCNCGGDCVNKCSNNTCGCGELTCIRRVPTDKNTNILYFGSFYIEY